MNTCRTTMPEARFWATVHMYQCVYVGQPFVVVASRNHPLLKAATALTDQPGYEYSGSV